MAHEQHGRPGRGNSGKRGLRTKGHRLADWAHTNAHKRTQTHPSQTVAPAPHVLSHWSQSRDQQPHNTQTDLHNTKVTSRDFSPESRVWQRVFLCPVYRMGDAAGTPHHLPPSKGAIVYQHNGQPYATDRANASSTSASSSSSSSSSSSAAAASSAPARTSSAPARASSSAGTATTPTQQRRRAAAAAPGPSAAADNDSDYRPWTHAHMGINAYGLTC